MKVYRFDRQIKGSDTKRSRSNVMGYTTDFEGRLNLDKQLTAEQQETLEDFAQERHGGNIDVYPGLPGFWCQWVPTEDGMGIEWDQGEKFYEYVEWLRYLVEHFIKPWGLKLNGSITWQGESSDDMGRIVVKDNDISVQEGTVTYKDSDEVTNSKVWTAINEALVNLGMTHQGGGDSYGGFEDTYVKGDYKVIIEMRN